MFIVAQNCNSNCDLNLLIEEHPYHQCYTRTRTKLYLLTRYLKDRITFTKLATQEIFLRGIQILFRNALTYLRMSKGMMSLRSSFFLVLFQYFNKKPCLYQGRAHPQAVYFIFSQCSEGLAIKIKNIFMTFIHRRKISIVVKPMTGVFEQLFLNLLAVAFKFDVFILAGNPTKIRSQNVCLGLFAL